MGWVYVVLFVLFAALAFAAWGWLGFRIAAQARTPFLRLVAVGLTDSEPNVHVYREGTSERTSAHTVGAFGGLQERGLAFAPETGTILAVTDEAANLTG